MAEQGRFGTFTGVFTPNVLTILGIILFLRIGWVVGQAGLAGSLLIILLANAVSLLTGLSLSAISTNMFVRTGGPYYMISRTLGLEIGGAIGLPLYLSQAISVAFYLIGFTEAFISVFPLADPRLLASGLALAFGILAFVGADFALKIQLGILAALALSLVSVFSGSWDAWHPPTLWASAQGGASFWAVFSIFFPAVTGITVGASMSGDLKDPMRSIPLGTLSAIGVTALIYVATAVWLAVHVPVDTLLTDSMVLYRIARWPVLVLVGVWASTLSSALGSILAAPRILKALAMDGVVPRLLGHQLGSATEPRMAVVLTTLIALAVIWMGNLDFVAPIITMFFLNTYGMINLTAGLERLVGNPSFRPQFKVPWILSLLGAAGCYTSMFLIDARATVAAVFLSYGVFFLLKRRSLRHDWGDIRSGIWLSIARFALMGLETVPWHIKNWRPNLVVFLRSPQKQESLLTLGTWMARARGFVTFYHVIEGDVEALAGKGYRRTSRRFMQKYLTEKGILAFTESSIVDDLYGGAVSILQAHGLAGLEPNMVLMGWAGRRSAQAEQLLLTRKLTALNKSVLFLRTHEERGFGAHGLIDVWWRGRDRNGELMLLIAHILRQSEPWQKARIRLLQLAEREEGVEGIRNHLEQLLHQVRVEAEVVVFTRADPRQPFTSVLRQQSGQSDLTLLGMRVPEPEEVLGYAEEIDRTILPLGSVLLVRNGETESILEEEAL